jgi:hypothetical protein
MSVLGDLLTQTDEKILVDPSDALLLQAETVLVITPGAGASLLFGAAQQFSAISLSSDGNSMPASGIVWTAVHGTMSTAGAYIANGHSQFDTITATDPGSGITSTIVINVIALVTLAVTPLRSAIALGSSQQFYANGVWANGYAGALPGEPTWNAVYNSISPTGLYGGTSTGVDTVTASLYGISGSATIGVLNAPALFPAETSLTFAAIDETATLEVHQTPLFSLFAISSSAPIVARVEDTIFAAGATFFVVTAVSAGTAVLEIVDEAGQILIVPITVAIAQPEVTVAIAS